MTSRFVDGRTTLHLAAQMDLPNVVKAMLAKSEKNKVEAEAKEKEEKAGDKDMKMKDGDDEERVRDSSEDDWTEEDEKEDDEDEDYDEAKKKVDAKGDPKPAADEDAMEDPDEPDILDLDAPDWDQSLTALGVSSLDWHFGSPFLTYCHRSTPSLQVRSIPSRFSLRQEPTARLPASSARTLGRPTPSSHLPSLLLPRMKLSPAKSPNTSSKLEGHPAPPQTPRL